jgi:hypothetical protein
MVTIEDAFKVVISGGIVNPGNVAVAALNPNSSPVVAAPLANALPEPISSEEDNLLPSTRVRNGSLSEDSHPNSELF